MRIPRWNTSCSNLHRSARLLSRRRVDRPCLKRRPGFPSPPRVLGRRYSLMRSGGAFLWSRLFIAPCVVVMGPLCDSDGRRGHYLAEDNSGYVADSRLHVGGRARRIVHRAFWSRRIVRRAALCGRESRGSRGRGSPALVVALGSGAARRSHRRFEDGLVSEPCGAGASYGRAVGILLPR